MACAAGAAAAVASSVVTAELHLGDFLDRVAAAVGSHEPALHELVLDFPRILSLNETRAFRRFESICLDDSYPPSPDGLSDYCVPAFCTAVYYFLRSPYAYEKAVDACLRAGGQMHVAAMLAGAMCGALVGDSGIPSRLVQSLLGSAQISDLARDLYLARSKSLGGPEKCSKPEDPSSSGEVT
jgi:ADP-ribosylglycohydrolase